MDDLAFGLQVTVLGMGIVFGLLILLWLLLTAAVRLDRRGAREVPAGDGADVGAAGAAAGSAPGTAAAEASGTVRLVGAPGDLDPSLLAAITIAILRHTEARRHQAAPAMRAYWPGSLLFASRWVAAGRTRQGQPWRRRR